MAETQKDVNTTVSWIALVVAGIALLIGISAYNRAGADLDTVIARNVDQATDAMQRQMALLETRTRLLALRARIEANEAGEEIAAEVDDIQADLAVAYENVAAETREEIAELDRELATLATQTREGSAEALGTLERAIEETRREVDPGRDE